MMKQNSQNNHLYRSTINLSIAEGEKALTANANKIDVIILDLMLPDGSGLTLCRDIKSDAKTKHIPIIILTAKTEEVDRVVGFELGADDYVTKPFSVRELILRVKAIIKRGTASTQQENDISDIEAGDLRMNIELQQHELILSKAVDWVLRS